MELAWSHAGMDIWMLAFAADEIRQFFFSKLNGNRCGELVSNLNRRSSSVMYVCNRDER